MGAKALSAQALESAIKSATSLDELKALVAKASTEKIMNPDGTIRGLVFCKPSAKRGAVLSVAIQRGKPGGLSTSMIVDGKDFQAVYRAMVKVIAGHLGVAEGGELMTTMYGSADAFLTKYRLRLVEVRYLQVTPVPGEIMERQSC